MPQSTKHTEEKERERAIGMVQLGASYDHVVRILNCTKLTITRLIQRYRVTGRSADRPRTSLLRHLQRLALDMSSVVALYVVDYDSMVSGPIDHSEG